MVSIDCSTDKKDPCEHNIGDHT